MISHAMNALAEISGYCNHLEIPPRLPAFSERGGEQRGGTLRHVGSGAHAGVPDTVAVFSYDLPSFALWATIRVAVIDRRVNNPGEGYEKG